ncbi:hypothetical protein MSM1_05065 [Mycobacterium sp. SM1]|uniref:hypothetical protein n=1 Tax=Mycobacterium sp. SM1 TaxID=2816243 RepID=UPI001BCBCB4B|nr:hypothetical protein [Mycobacterium sp. SM1]MBS4727744.1 hypothetical protein [Mycobacterium sp. SM1]
MLVTLGLGRLERWLAHDAVTASDVAEFLEHAEAVDVSTLAREGMPKALDHLHRRRAERLTDAPARNPTAGKHHADPLSAATVIALGPAPTTRRHRRSQPNPQFKPTRHADHV